MRPEYQPIFKSLFLRMCAAKRSSSVTSRSPPIKQKQVMSSPYLANNASITEVFNSSPVSCCKCGLWQPSQPFGQCVMLMAKVTSSVATMTVTSKTIAAGKLQNVYAGGTAVAKATVKFLPLKGDCSLNIYGQGAGSVMEITLNGKTIYDGKNPLNRGWNGPYSKHTWKFPSSWIVKGENELRIKNKEKDWFPIRVNYAAILMPKKKKSLEEQMRPKNELDELTLDE